MASVWKIQDTGASPCMVASGLVSRSRIPLREGVSTSAVTSQWPSMTPAMASARSASTVRSRLAGVAASTGAAGGRPRGGLGRVSWVMPGGHRVTLHRSHPARYRPGCAARPRPLKVAAVPVAAATEPAGAERRRHRVGAEAQAEQPDVRHVADPVPGLPARPHPGGGVQRPRRGRVHARAAVHRDVGDRQMRRGQSADHRA